MIDPDKVKVGDTLRIDVKVADVKTGATYPIEVETIAASPVWLWRPVVEAAEHIPAPKRFQHGDWVRHTGCTPTETECPLGIGYVLEALLDPAQVTVFFAGWNSEFSKGQGDKPGVIERYSNDQLEHDEAPE